MTDAEWDAKQRQQLLTILSGWRATLDGLIMHDGGPAERVWSALDEALTELDPEDNWTGPGPRDWEPLPAR